MSAHRNKKAITLDDEYAYKLEELLNLPHGKVVADQHAEREKNPEIKKMWQKLASIAASVLLAIALTLNPTINAEASESTQERLSEVPYNQRLLLSVFIDMDYTAFKLSKVLAFNTKPLFTHDFNVTTHGQITTLNCIYTKPYIRQSRLPG